MSNHILSNGHLMVVLAVVNLELESNKVGQNRSRSGLRSYGRDLVADGLGPDNGKAIKR